MLFKSTVKNPGEVEQLLDTNLYSKEHAKADEHLFAYIAVCYDFGVSTSANIILFSRLPSKKERPNLKVDSKLGFLNL